MGSSYVITYLNCIIESLILTVLWNVLLDEPFSKIQKALTFVLLCSSSVVIAYLENSFLILSFALLLLSTYVGYRQVGWFNVVLNSLFALLALLYLQAFVMWFFPTAFFISRQGQLLINLTVLLIVIVLKLVSRKFCWSEIYNKNKSTVWIFILLLAVPSIVIMQIIALNMEETNRLLIFCLLLLQISYLLALILTFLLFNRRQERRQIKHTTDAIDTLNLYMEDSKRRIHDFNKHIHFLHSIISTQSSDSELKATVDNYCKDVLNSAEQEEIMLQIEDPIFRALLYRREIQARKFGVDFQIEGTAILPSFPMRDFQLVEIFDNLLDNAFECVTQMGENRWIKISLQTFSLKEGVSKHLLCVQNPYDSLDFSAIINQKGFTSKGGEHQGIGLEKVAQIVTETGGKLLLNHDNKVFTIKIVYETKI